jgi:hypothetical protein
MSGAQRERFALTLERGATFDADTFRVLLRTEQQRDVSVVGALVLPDRIGYLRLVQFGPRAGKELEDALRNLRPSDLRGVIVDLRNNPGGHVQSAVEIAQLFLPKGTLVFRTDGRIAEADREYRTERAGAFADLPLVLLVDGGSASASEALAGALQDHKRAQRVGRRTFGKALVPSPFFLKSGDAIWLTIARVLSPGGRMIQRDYGKLAPEAYRSLESSEAYAGGLLPDIAVATQAFPSWWARAVADGTVYTIADSIAATLSSTEAARNAWLPATTQWEERLLPALLARVRPNDRDQSIAKETRQAMARQLAARAAEVRWGAQTAIELLLSTDSDVRAAQSLFLAKSSR